MVNCGCLCCCAVGAPFLVLLLALRAPCCASRVSVDVESRNLVNTMQIHATLREQILTPWFIACELLPTQIVQGRLAIMEVCHVCARSIVAKDFKAAEEAVVDIFAALKVDTVLCHFHLAQILTEPDGEEHIISINLHSPILARSYALLFDRFPGRDEDV